MVLMFLHSGSMYIHDEFALDVWTRLSKIERMSSRIIFLHNLSLVLCKIVQAQLGWLRPRFLNQIWFPFQATQTLVRNVSQTYYLALERAELYNDVVKAC